MDGQAWWATVMESQRAGQHMQVVGGCVNVQGASLWALGVGGQQTLILETLSRLLLILQPQ